MKQVTTKNKRVNIWQYQFILTRRLAWWGVMSFTAGLALFFAEPILRGFGIQSLVWGVINTAIAMGGAALTVKRRSKLEAPSSREVVEQETRKLTKLLQWMLPLDAIYIIVGLVLAFTWGRKDAWWWGTGWGVVVQGLFLLGFDWYHKKNVPTI